MSERRTLVFQGDSITDAGRDREYDGNLGNGYVNMVAGALLYEFASDPLDIRNRGISGNRTRDLLNRWRGDCIDLKPDFLSLYIGVNNTWRRYDRDDPTPADVFRRELHDLLDQSFDQTPATPAATVLLEPFVLDAPAGTKAHWHEDLDPKREIVRHAAETYGTRFIPLQRLFHDALKRAPSDYWAPDGIHPSPAGHALIARAWLDTMRPVIYT